MNDPTPEPRTVAAPRAPLRGIAWLVFAGVALRIALALAAGRSELQSDEANYVYLGLAQQRFGILLDAYRYLWPPLHPWLLGEALARFGLAGITAVQLLQACASAAIGASVGLLAWRLGSARAGLVATALWAVHLPLAGYTHLLWSEPLFLALFTPALERLVAALQADSAAEFDRRCLAAGLLLGASLYVKTLAQYLAPVLALTVVAVAVGRFGKLAAVRGASLVVLLPFVITLPWGLRNLEVYGRYVPSGATLGENAYIGLNARYMNFDYVALGRVRALRGDAPIEELAPAALIAPPATEDGEAGGWRRAEEQPHVVLRQQEQLERGLAFALEHPGWTLRTRLKRVADFVTPLSFPVRHAALGLYDGSALGRAPLRHVTVLWAVCGATLVLALAGLGLARGLRAAAGWAVFLPTLVYVAASALLLSMSRVRLPIEPLLLVLAALGLCHALEPFQRRRIQRATWAAAGCLLAAFAALVALQAREVWAVVQDALQGGAA